MSGEACKWCDRAECQSDRIAHTRACSADNGAPGMKQKYCPGCAALCECAKYPHDWRAEAVSLRAAVATLTAERDAAVAKRDAMLRVGSRALKLMRGLRAERDAAIRERDKFHRQIVQWEGDMRAACGELRVSFDDMPLGSVASQLMMANAIMRGERNLARDVAHEHAVERDDALRTLAAVRAARAEYDAPDSTPATFIDALDEALKEAP